LYLSETKRIVHSDGSISFDDVGSITSSKKAIIDKNGKWADTYENGEYRKKYELNILYNEDGSIDYDNSMIRYNDNEIDRLGIYYDVYYSHLYEFYKIQITPLFLLLYKFCIKLKNKLIIDKIVISPFEKEIEVYNTDIHDIVYTHHVNCFYENIQDNLQIENDFEKLNLFYTLVSLIPIGRFSDDDLNYDKSTYYILGNEHDKYVDILLSGSASPEMEFIIPNKFVYSLIMDDPDILEKYNKLQPHNNTMRYDIKGLLDYLPVQNWPKF
jgi:hypothetical protein